MGDSLKEVDQALQAIERFEPLLAAFLPELMPFLPIFNAGVQAVDTVSADRGKDISTVIQDVVSHLTPGAPNAPALAPEAPERAG